MEPASAEKLLKAFQILDVEGKGTISKEYITKLMSEEGEPFTQASECSVIEIKMRLVYVLVLFQDEIEEMMAAAVDVHSGDIHYEYYINSLMVNQTFCFVYGFFSGEI